MGRKIPGKKHRKVKDPNVQKGRRLAELKDKINNPPGKVDIQEIPKSVLRIMELKEKAKMYTLQKKKNKGKKLKDASKDKRRRFDVQRALGTEVKLPGMDRPDRYIPELKQGTYENVGKFAMRVTNVCDDVIKEVKFEEKYGVEVKRDEYGKITEVKQLKTPKRSKKPKLAEKRRLREQSKEEAKEQPKEFVKRDKFEFGDIVHQPPTNLPFPGKKQKIEGDPNVRQKPGERDLLLKEVLKTGGGETPVMTPKKKKTPLEKQREEERRKLVVEAFRKSKKQQLFK